MIHAYGNDNNDNENNNDSSNNNGNYDTDGQVIDANYDMLIRPLMLCVMYTFIFKFLYGHQNTPFLIFLNHERVNQHLRSKRNVGR